MNLTDYNAAAIDAVFAAIRANRPTPREYLIADVRDDNVCHDDTIAARAIRADIESHTKTYPDGSKNVWPDLTDPTFDRIHEVEVLRRLADGIAGGPQAAMQFGLWFCGWFAADTAAHVRRLAGQEVEP